VIPGVKNMDTTITLSRKDQIFQTAAKLFREKGFEAASMRDIAAELGIEAASLYSHIKSKDEILETICFRMADEFLTAIAEVNDIYFNAEEKLRMAIKNHVQIIADDLDASTVFLREWRNLTGEKLKDFIGLRNKYENGFREIITLGEDENVFETVDKKFAVLTILSAVNWIVEWYKPDGNMTPEEIAKNLSDFILTGLGKKATS
jgi:TetR/AcrR family transcriptional regulator, cholesterol catabolism regulator